MGDHTDLETISNLLEQSPDVMASCRDIRSRKRRIIAEWNTAKKHIPTMTRFALCTFYHYHAVWIGHVNSNYNIYFDIMTETLVWIKIGIPKLIHPYHFFKCMFQSNLWPVNVHISKVQLPEIINKDFMSMYFNSLFTVAIILNFVRRN